MADMQYGGWYNNPAAGGANQRYWGAQGWTTGAEPGGSGGGSSGGGGQSYEDIYKKAQALVPQVDTSALEGVAADVKTHAQTNYDNINAQIPLTRNVYQNVADQLDYQYGKQSAAVNAQGVADVGQQTDQAAQSGFSTTGGYEASMLRAVKSSYNNQITDLLNQYGLQREAIANDEEKSVAVLTQQASQALLDGDTARANILTSIAQIKQGNQAAIATVAGQFSGYVDAQAKNALTAESNRTAQFNADTSRITALKPAAGSGDGANTSVLAALVAKLQAQADAAAGGGSTAPAKAKATDNFAAQADSLLAPTGNTYAALQQKNKDLQFNMSLSDSLKGVKYTSPAAANPNSLQLSGSNSNVFVGH